MLKESDKEPPTLSGLPIFWAINSSVQPIDVQTSTGENLWVLEETGITICLADQNFIVNIFKRFISYHIRFFIFRDQTLRLL